MALLCACATTFCQSNAYDLRTIKDPLYVDDWVRQDVPLGKFINHKSSSATLTDFKGKLVILSFWFTSCTACIAQFPKEDSLQEQYASGIQMIMVTFESEEKVNAFIKGWEKKNNTRFKLPIIVEDQALTNAFRVRYNPHYVWILPDGKMIGQTSEHFINQLGIEGMLAEAAKREAYFKKIKAVNESK